MEFKVRAPRQLLIGLAVSCSCVPLLATTIVAFWTPERIVVAADSKGRVGGVRGKAVVSTCKIVPISNYFYALSGLAQEPETRFDAHGLIADVAHSDKSIKGRMDNFEDVALPALRRAMDHIRARHPENYESDFGSKGGIGLDVVFFGIENGTPVMIGRRMGMRNFAVENSKLEYSADLRGVEFGALYVGQHEAINLYRGTHPNWRQELGLPTAARKFVQLEIDHSAGTVGSPIDTLVLDRNGARWVDKDPASRCPDL